MREQKGISTKNVDTYGDRPGHCGESKWDEPVDTGVASWLRLQSGPFTTTGNDEGLSV